MKRKIITIKDRMGDLCLVDLDFPVDSKLFEFIKKQDFVNPFTLNYRNKNLIGSNLLLEIPFDKITALEKLVLDYYKDTKQ